MLTSPVPENQNVKQIIIINQSLKLTRKKRDFQMAQASLGAFFEAGKQAKRLWIKEGRPKIILNVFGQDDLQDLFLKAEKRKLPICLVADETQRLSPVSSVTCLGIGPVSDNEVEQLMEIINYYRWIRESALNARLQEDDCIL